LANVVALNVATTAALVLADVAIASTCFAGASGKSKENPRAAPRQCRAAPPRVLASNPIRYRLLWHKMRGGQSRTCCERRADPQPRANAGLERLRRWPGPAAGRLKLVGFSFALAGRRRLPTLRCKLMLFRRVRRLRSESGGPPLFEPSLKVEGDTAHNPKLRLVAPVSWTLNARGP